MWRMCFNDIRLYCSTPVKFMEEINLHNCEHALLPVWFLATEQCSLTM